MDTIDINVENLTDDDVKQIIIFCAAYIFKKDINGNNVNPMKPLGDLMSKWPASLMARVIKILNQNGKNYPHPFWLRSVNISNTYCM